MYFGDAKLAEMLRHYNQLERGAIERRRFAAVPAYHVRLNPAKQPAADAESRARRDRRRDAVTRLARALPAARLAWSTGDFDGVRQGAGADRSGSRLPGHGRRRRGRRAASARRMRRTTRPTRRWRASGA